MSERRRDEIDGLLSTLTAAEAATLEAERIEAAMRNQLTNAVAALLGKDPQHIELGSWECETSPTGKCVYDRHEDPALDCCLYCGDPDERK